MVRVPSWVQVRLEVSGGIRDGPADQSLHVDGSAVGLESGEAVAHFLMKTALRVSTSRVLLASVLSSAG